MKKQKYSEEEIKRAESIDIVDYCINNDIPIEKDSERYYRHSEHDSLVIDRRKNKFYWNSKGKNGNAINFLQEVERLTFKGAMTKLLDKEAVYEKSDEIVFITQPYKYDDKNETENFDKAKEYLINERKIDPELVNTLHEQGLIKQDKNKNVLFLWKDHEKVMGCTEQGTYRSDNYKRGTWKSIQKNSTEGYGFSFGYGEPRNLKFFESSIDAMSYASIYKDKLENTRLISMEGLKHVTVINYMSKYTKEMKTAPDSVKLCVDNDDAGRAFVKKFQFLKVNKEDGGSYRISGEFPKNDTEGKKFDWNDECKLQAKLKEKKVIQNKGMELTT